MSLLLLMMSACGASTQPAPSLQQDFAPEEVAVADTSVAPDLAPEPDILSVPDLPVVDLPAVPDVLQLLEECNGVDDDGDGEIDEFGALGCEAYFLDWDGDGFGIYADSLCLCSPEEPHTAIAAGDCNDADPAVSPAAAEDPCNNEDDNCDGSKGYPDCSGHVCGSNGCGGICGVCQPGWECSVDLDSDGSPEECAKVPPGLPKMEFQPAFPIEGGDVHIFVTDGVPWANVGLEGSGPCGPVAPAWVNVVDNFNNSWTWHYKLGPLAGGVHDFTFTANLGGQFVISGQVLVSGPSGCGTVCGDGLCQGAENCMLCSSDCGSCVPDEVCLEIGASCEDHYPETHVCFDTGQSSVVTCHKYGTCTGIGGGVNCSWGAGSWCDDPCGAPPGCGPDSPCPGGQTCENGVCISDEPPPPGGNRFGIGLVGPGDPGQLDLAHELAGDGGYVLLILPGVHKGQNGPEPGWADSVQGAYDRNLIPVIRIGPGWGDTNIRKDSDDPQHLSYGTLAQSYKSVIAGLPLKLGWPLYVQVHNEPNLCYEWKCGGAGWLDSATRAAEYAHYFVDVADAIHSIGDQRVNVSLGALAPGGAVNCHCCGGEGCDFEAGETGLDFMNHMKNAIPDVWNRLDFLASHSYPAQGIGWGFFLPYDQCGPGLNYFQNELNTIGKELPVLITETGWSTKRPPEGPWPSEEQKAQYTVQAYQDVWLTHPAIAGVMPFMLQDGFWGDQEGFGWVHTGGAHFPVFDQVKALRCSLGLGPC